MANGLDHFVHRLRFLLDPMRHEGATDAQLLDRWATNHDSRAFAVLVGRHGALVWRVSKSVVRRPEEAEDVFQATFFVLARKAASLRKHSSVAGWLYQTAYKLALKARTANARRLHYEEQATPKTIPNPLEEISVREAGSILAQELDRLSAVYREPLLLCLYEGATQDEAAQQIGCSLNTLKRRLERGRALLSQRLSRRGLEPASALAFTLYAASQAPAQLIHKTLTAASHFACGQAVTGTAALLANGALQTLLLKKASIYLTLVVALGGMTMAAGLAFVQGKPVAEQAAQGEPKPAEKEKPKPRVDALGDPLPPGAIQRIGSSRLRHGGDVNRIRYTPNGKAIASISSDGLLNMWDAVTGKMLWRIKAGNPKSDRALFISEDGQKLAVLSDLSFAIVSSNTGKDLARHEFPLDMGGTIACCWAIAPDLGTFARGFVDGTLRLYDALDGREKMCIDLGKAQSQKPLDMAFSKDGKKIYALANKKSGVLVFDAKTGKASHILGTTKEWDFPCSLAVSDKRLAVMEPSRFTVWDLTTGKNYLIEEHEQIRGFPLLRQGCFSPDNSIFAHIPFERVVLVDTSTGEEQRRLAARTYVKSIAFAPDGKSIAYGDGPDITLCGVANGELMPPTPEPKCLRHICFTNDGSHIISVGLSIDWWDVESAKFTRHLQRDPGWDITPSISPDGKMLATSWKNDVILVNTVSRAVIRTFTGLKRSGVFWGEYSTEGISWWSSQTAISPDGTKLFTPVIGPGVIIWDIASGKPLHELRIPELKNKNLDNQVVKLAVSPNGYWLASTTMGNNEIRIWEVANGKLLHRLPPTRGRALSLFFSPDSSRLVSVTADRQFEAGNMQVWDITTGKEMNPFTTPSDRISCAAITADGRMLVTGSHNSSVRLWEFPAGLERGRIVGHDGPIYSVDFSPNGSLLAVASSDAPIYLWNPYSIKNQYPSTKLAKDDREKLWRNLADLDATIAFQAICELITRPGEAVTLLQAEWTRLPKATPQQMHKWVEDLNSDQFRVRKAATVAIERFTAGHEDLLREALKDAGSLEVRQRLERILGRLDPQRLRNSRMLEVLEQIRNDPARQFLRALAEQKEDTAMAREAAAGLKRVERSPTVPR